MKCPCCKRLIERKAEVWLYMMEQRKPLRTRDLVKHFRVLSKTNVTTIVYRLHREDRVRRVGPGLWKAKR